MEQKLLIRMLLGFVIITAGVIGSLYVVSSEALPSLPESRVFPSPSANPIVISPKPSPVLGAEATSISSLAPTPTPIDTKQTQLERASIYSLINAHRKEKDLSSLRVHPALEQSSQRKLTDMIQNKYWQHENPSGIIDWTVFNQSGYEYSAAGENLSFGNNTPWSVFNSWVESSIHNRELLNPEYEDMGIALDCGTYQQAGNTSCVVVLHLGKQQL